MADRRDRSFRPTVQGLLVLVVPPILFLPGLLGFSVPSAIVGLGIPGVAILSAVFLIIGIPSLIRRTVHADQGLSSLPSESRIGDIIHLEADPPRPGFVPGIRLSIRWDFRFGPFRKSAHIVLPGEGKGRCEYRFHHRGRWTSRPSLVATDPFGFFVFQSVLPVTFTVLVPPDFGLPVKRLPRGRADAEADTAPRLSEEADDRPERRPYIPGDDPRRLDWKHYARTGDLLIRIGEDGVPTRGRLWLQVLSDSHDELDKCLSFVRSFSRNIVEAGQELYARLPGEGRWALVEDSSWIERLAGSLPIPENGEDLPKAGETLCLVASARSPQAALYRKKAAAAGCRIINLPVSIEDPERRLRWWTYA